MIVIILPTEADLYRYALTKPKVYIPARRIAGYAH